MLLPHPKLCFRPQPHPGLRRPKLTHPVLGNLEFINRNGSWWQGRATIAGSSARMDVQQGANPADAALNAAADTLQWVQENEPAIRTYMGERLATGDFRTNPQRQVSTTMRYLDDPTILSGLRPCKIVLWGDYADLEYDCTALPDGNLLGGHTVNIRIDAGKSPTLCSLYYLDFCQKAERFFERPLPADAVDFENSVADQLIAKAAEWGWLRLDAELSDMLEKAIDRTDARINDGSAECVSYMKSVKLLLRDIPKTSTTRLKTIFVSLQARHHAGKRVPFKDKLVFASCDQARFVGAGAYPMVCLFSLHVSDFAKGPEPVEALPAAFQDGLKVAAQWLAKQSLTVFHDLRQAGFVTEVFLSVAARIESDGVNIKLTPDFLSECARLGLTISMSVDNTVDD
jgi:hypothetical protein